VTESDSDPSVSTFPALMISGMKVSSRPAAPPVASITVSVGMSATPTTCTVNGVVVTAVLVATSPPLAASVDVTSSCIVTSPEKCWRAWNRMLCTMASSWAVLGAVIDQTPPPLSTSVPPPARFAVSTPPVGTLRMRADKVSDPSLSAPIASDRLVSMAVSSLPDALLALATGESATARTVTVWLTLERVAVDPSASVAVALIWIVAFVSDWAGGVTRKLSSTVCSAVAWLCDATDSV
jgi:hypothetical protein